MTAYDSRANSHATAATSTTTTSSGSKPPIQFRSSVPAEPLMALSRAIPNAKPAASRTAVAPFPNERAWPTKMGRNIRNNAVPNILSQSTIAG